MTLDAGATPRDRAAFSGSAGDPAGGSTDARVPLVRVRDLTIAYQTKEAERVPAVRHVSFDLVPGEVLALVGESASGKTSAALALLRLTASNGTIESGSIRFRDREITTLDDDALRALRGHTIAMVFQDPLASINPTMTIGQQVAEVFAAHGATPKQAADQARAALREAEIPDVERVLGAYPFQISGGMAQRILFAMATAHRPEVLIVDEPTASLDPIMAQHLLLRLEQLRDERQVALLLITHDLGVVARLADRVAVMYAGAIVEEGTVRTIFNTPRHPYTWGLLASRPGAGRRRDLLPMPGQPPDLATLPDHCPFLPRCSKATSHCRLEPEPPLAGFAGENADPGHRVACYNPVAVPITAAWE